MTNPGKAKCNKHDREIDMATGEKCPDPGNPCKYRSGCVIHAYCEEKDEAKKRCKSRKHSKQRLLP